MQKLNGFKGLSGAFILSAVSFSLYSTPVYAEAKPYVAVDFGISNASAERMVREIGVSECSVGLASLERCDTSNSGRGWAGYLGAGIKLSPTIAVELGYFDIADDTDTVHIAARSSSIFVEGWQNISVEMSAITLRGIANLPINEAVSLNFSFGLSQLYQKHTEVADINALSSPIELRHTARNIVPTFGAGITYQITENWALRGQYIALPAPANSQDAEDQFISTGTIGLTYTF